MKRIRASTQFKKDLKRYRNQPEQLSKLARLIDLLSEGAEIPAENKPHSLRGVYTGYMECHVESDLLLIWVEDDMIDLVRFGSHSELF